MELISKIKRAVTKKINVGTDVLKINTLIGEKTTIDGNISVIGNCKTDGRINGDVKASGDLVIGVPAQITGNVSGNNIIVAGVVTGNINARGQLCIKKTATVNGEHTAFSLVAEEGSVFVGNCNIIEKND
jgi:cytoskeletal protein CcmA (bactofilin family)